MVSVKYLIGHQEINFHIVFDVHMDFQLKSMFVAGGHTTEAPNTITYSSVMSRDSVCIGFLLEYLHGFYIIYIDLENDYLNAPCVEKIWFVGGDECGGGKGCVLIIFCTLYCLISTGFSCRSASVAALREIGLETTFADPNVLIRAALRPDVYKYYEFILV